MRFGDAGKKRRITETEPRTQRVIGSVRPAASINVDSGVLIRKLMPEKYGVTPASFKCASSALSVWP